MSTPQHHIAAGRKDLETAALGEDLLNIIYDIIEGKLLGAVSNGKVLSTSISGQIGPSQGGTGNARGETTPLDGSVTDAKVATGANIQPSKLDQTLLKTLLYNLLKIMLLGDSDIAVTPNDTLQTLVWSIISPGGTLDSLSDVIISAPAAGDTLMAFLEGSDIIWRNIHGLPSLDGGALYVGGDYLTIGGDTLTVGS